MTPEFGNRVLLPPAFVMEDTLDYLSGLDRIFHQRAPARSPACRLKIPLITRSVSEEFLKASLTLRVTMYCSLPMPSG
jgi:hypothetical protein